MLRDGFRPAWWLPGPHAQTLGARVLRSARGVRLARERLELPDGDFLDLDWAELDGSAGGARPDRAAAPLVLVLHGLEGCAASTYALEVYRALAKRGLAAVGMNFRSCSGEPNRLPRLYHSGETGDLRYVAALLRARFPGRRLGVVGFSLGGNVLLKYLGETGRAGATGPEIPDAAVAISVPFDLSRGAAWLDRGWSKIYRRYLIRRLLRKVRAKAAILDGHVDLDALLRVRTFREFDNAGTAPLHGFADADDYYARSSARRYLSDIRTPVLILHAADDPFLPADAIPRHDLAANPHLATCLVPRGGHVGFVSGPPWGPVFWAEQQAAAYLAEQLSAA